MEARDPAFAELIEVVRSGRPVIFAGAGVAAAAGLPPFRRLVEILAERMEALRADEGTLRFVRDQIRVERYFDALDAARASMGMAEVVAAVQGALDDRGRRVPRLARAIAGLAPALHAVLTTNMDRVLERALGGAWPVYRDARSGLPEEGKFLFEMHGSVDQPSSWVLFREDHDRAPYADPEQRDMLRRALAGRPLIFVGVGLRLEEPPLRPLFDLLGTDGGPRFAFVPENEISLPRRRELSEARILAVAYANTANRHEGLVDLLEELRAAAGLPEPAAIEEPEDAPRSTPAPRSQGSKASSPPPPHEPAPAPPAPPPTFSVPPFVFAEDTLRVLDASLQIRAARKEKGAWLSSSAVMFGVAEVGRLAAPEPRTAARWLFGELGRDAYEAALDVYLEAKIVLAERSAEVVCAELATTTRSPNLVNLLAEAASLARRVSRSGVVAARHLLAALLVHRPTTRVPNSQRRLDAFGPGVDALRRALLAFVAAVHPEDDAAAWREAILGAQPLPAAERLVPGYAADGADDADVLELRDEYEGFAAVIASEELVPPLSVGLFGSWGSGKSFFMRKLDAALHELRDTPGFCRSIARIQFNAWHYAESNLWASLVEHIFESLVEHLEEKKTAAAAINALFENLETAKQIQEEATLERKRAATELTTAEGTLKQKESAAAERASKLELLLRADVLSDLALSSLDADTKKKIEEVSSALGLPGLGASARELKDAAAQARLLEGRSRDLVAVLVRDPTRAVVAGVIALLLPIVVVGTTYVARHLGDLDGVRSAIAGAASTLGTIAAAAVGVLSWGGKVVSRIMRKLHEVDAVIGERAAEAEKARKEDIERANAAVGSARAEVTAAERRIEQAIDRVRAAELALEESKPERRIARFLRDRIGSDDYRKHLGLVAMVHRDFKKLSDLMYPPEDAEAPPLPEGPPLPRIDRIVLYIDDLDRCPPARVVEVLEAVHMLLAFKLFVVIVGVDSRWMTRALLERYPKQLDEKDGIAGAGPHDYLEKIFQIPYWIRPLDEVGAFRMISGLLASGQITTATAMAPDPPKPAPEPAKPAKEEAAKPASEPAKPAKEEAAKPASEPAKPASEPAKPVKEEAVKPASEPAKPAKEEAAKPAPEPAKPANEEAAKPASEAAKPAKEEAAKPAPEPAKPAKEDAAKPDDEAKDGDGATPPARATRLLSIDSLEVEFMQGLSRYIGRSPRRVKRFINVYRLFKATLPAAARPTFLKRDGASGDYQGVLVLLAILTGAPRWSPVILDGLASASPDAPVRDFLVAALRDHAGLVGEERANIVGALELYLQTHGQGTTVHDLGHWAPIVARYSFACPPSAVRTS